MEKYLPLIAGIIVVFFNVLIFIGNVIWSIYHTNKDKKYNYKLDYYKLLFTDNLSQYIKYTANLEKELSIIINSVKNCKNENKRLLIERSCNKIKEYFNKFEREQIVLLIGYSINLYKDILSYSENLYDETTEYITTLDSDNSLRATDLIQEKYKYSRKKYLSRIFRCVENYKPKNE